MPCIRKQSPLSTPTILVGGADRGGHFFKSTIITNSGVMQIGDPVSVTTQAAGNGMVTRRYNAAGDPIVGVCVGFGRGNGQAVAFDSGTNDTVTGAADNETVNQIYAILDITPGAAWSCPISGTIHGTQVFGVGRWVDPVAGANCDQIDETTITATAYQGRGWVCLGPDPDNTTRGLVMVGESFITLADET